MPSEIGIPTEVQDNDDKERVSGSDNLETNAAATDGKHRSINDEDSGLEQAPEASSTSILHQLLSRSNQIPITCPPVDGIPASELLDMSFIEKISLPEAVNISPHLSLQSPPPPMAPATIRSSSTSNPILNLIPSHCLPHFTFDPQQQFQLEIHPGKFVVYHYLIGPNNIPIAYTPTAGQCLDKPFPLSIRNSQTGETNTFSVRPFLTEYPARSGKFVFFLAVPAEELVSAGNQAPPPSASSATQAVPQMVPNQQVSVNQYIQNTSTITDSSIVYPESESGYNTYNTRSPTN